MALISITRLRVRSWWFMAGFGWHSHVSARQAQRSPGYLRGRVYRDAHLAFWTATLWQDEASMRAFRSSEPHLSAMRKLARWCDEASMAHWVTEDTSVPDIHQLHRWMIERGRPSRVNRPSAQHAAMQLAPPVDRGGQDLPPARRDISR
jgi:hypothetical protein